MLRIFVYLSTTTNSNQLHASRVPPKALQQLGALGLEQCLQPGRPLSTSANIGSMFLRRVTAAGPTNPQSTLIVCSGVASAGENSVASCLCRRGSSCFHQTPGPPFGTDIPRPGLYTYPAMTVVDDCYSCVCEGDPPPTFPPSMCSSLLCHWHLCQQCVLWTRPPFDQAG